MSQTQHSYTEGDAENMRDIEDRLAERFNNQSEADEEADSVSKEKEISVGTVINVDERDDNHISLEIRPKGSGDTFSEIVPLPSSRDDFSNKWNRIFAYAGLDNPSKARRIWYEDVPICRDSDDQWELDCPPKRNLADITKFKIRRMSYSYGLVSLGLTPFNISLCFGTLLLIFGAYESVTFQYWDSAIGEPNILSSIYHIFMLVYTVPASIFFLFFLLVLMSNLIPAFLGWLNNKIIRDPW